MASIDSVLTDDNLEQTLKRKMSDRSSTSSLPEPKKQYTCQFKELETDAANMPTSEASAGDWAKFILSQFSVLNHNFKELAKSNNFACDSAKEAMAHSAEAIKLIGDLSCSVQQIANENLNLKQENADLREKFLKLECHQRRDNLVFEGFAEVRGESDADIYWKLVHAISNIADIDPYYVRISRCHRVGKFTKGHRRPIVAHFNWFGDRQAIFKNRNRLPPGIFVHEDFPEEVEDRRKMLRPILNEAMKKEKYKGQAFITVDKLIIAKKVYTVKPRNNLHELPDDLNPETLCQKTDGNTLVFFGYGSAFSNFHSAPYKSDNVKYSCSEQQIQASKAKLFNDDVTAERIMAAKSPYEMKKLGGRVKNFSGQQWREAAPAIAKKAVLAKFSQNSHLKKKLLDTGDMILAEATRDKLWGTGVGLREAGCLDNQNWTGRGCMGDALLYVRDVLKARPTLAT